MFRQPFSRDSSRVSGSNNNKKKKSHASQTTVTPPQILLKKVIFNKINDRESIKLFVERRVEELIGFDDEVLIGIIYNTMFEEKDDERLLTDAQDGVELYKQLLPFLEAENTDTFMEELWEILTNIDEETGIPIKFIEERKLAKQKRDEVANTFRQNRDDKHKRREDRRGEEDRRRGRDRNNHHRRDNHYNNNNSNNRGDDYDDNSRKPYQNNNRNNNNRWASAKRDLPYDR